MRLRILTAATMTSAWLRTTRPFVPAFAVLQLTASPTKPRVAL